MSYNKELGNAAAELICNNLKQLKKLFMSEIGLTGAYMRSTNRALTTLPAALPSTISNLKALTELRLARNRLTGEHLCSTNRAP